MKPFLLACLAYLFFVWAGKAQTPYMQQMQFPYQLPTKTIYDMLLSRQDILWLGTDKGLFRFNGKSAFLLPFKGAKQSDITHLKEDQHGRVWGMNFARQVFCLENDTLRPFPLQMTDEHGGLMNFVFTERHLWVLTSQALACYDLQTKKRVFVHLAGKEYFERIGSFQNKIYVLAEKKVLIFEENGHYTTAPVPLSFHGSFVEWQKGWYCIQAREQPKASVKWEKAQFIRLPEMRLPEGTYMHHSVSTPSHIWLCARQGGFSLNPNTGKTSLVFPLGNVTDVVQDFQGNYWVSTLYDGLWFCPSLHNVAYNLPAEKNTGELACVYAFEDNLYLGTTNGFVLRAPTKQGNTPLLQQVEMFSKASNSEIRRMVFDASNRQIAMGSGIFDLQGKPVFQKTLIKDARFSTIEGQKYFLMATSNGFRFLHLNPPSLESKRRLFGFVLDSTSSRILGYPAYFDGRTQRTYSAEIDSPAQRFWIGFDNGLFVYDFTGKATEIRVKGESLIAQSLVLDAQARLWVGSFQQGLFVFEGERLVAHWCVGKGLKNNHIRKIVAGKDKVWIGTNAEIGYIDLAKMQFIDVLTQSGLAGFAYKDFYPTESGLWIALPQSLLFVPHALPTLRETLRLLPVERLPENAFQVRALHYKNPSKVQIKYRLQGIDTQWNSLPETEAIIRYNHLPKGDYALDIFAEDEIIGIKSKTQTLRFQILAKWWETWAFFILVFVMVNGVIVSVLYRYFERKRKQQLLKEQLWISQLKALRSQMNPHFLYNILNTVQGLVYSNRKTEAGELLGNFSDLMRKTLQASENAYIPLREEMEILELYLLLEKARFDESFSYQWITENVEDFMHIAIPSMLIQPFIENAFKHGLLHKKGEKRLRILFKVKETPTQNILCITIDDNGIGRQASQEINQKRKQKSVGFATKAFEQRISLLNQKKQTISFEIQDKVSPTGIPEGTTLHLSFII